MEIVISLSIIYIKNILLKPKTLLLYTFFIIASLYNGYLVALYTVPINSRSLFLIISALIFFCTLIRKFFPAFESFAKPIKSNYPIKRIKRYFINLINDSLLNIHFILITCFLISFFIYSLNISLYEKIFITLCLIIALILRRSLVATVFQENNRHNISFLIIIWFINILICFFFTLYFENIRLIFYIPIVLIFLINGYLIEEKYSNFKFTSISSYNIFKNPHLETVFSNSKFRLWFTTAIILKVIFLVLFTILYIKKGKYPPFFFIVLFTGPIILFNYVLNNTFGFFDKFWFTLEKSSTTGKLLFLHFLKLISLPLLIDILIIIIFSIVNKSIANSVLLIYFGPLPVIIPLAFYWSVLFPKTIQSTFFSSKTTSAFLPSIITILVCILFIFIELNFWPIFLGVIYLIFSLLLIKNLNKFYKSKKHLLFKELIFT